MRAAFLLSLGASIAALSAVAPARAEAPYTMADFAHVRKFDAHTHLNVDDDTVLKLARADNFEVLSINVDDPDFPSIAEQARVAALFEARDPQHFHFATTFSMKGFGEPGWAERTRAHIADARAHGALAVKIWKNVGMVEKDPSGKRVFIDDPRFDPVIAEVVALKMPLIAHQGEPKNCWLPLDQMSTDNDREYFKDHPQYYMYLHPELPSYELLMARRDHFVARHPELSFVGAHLASLEWSVDELRKFLDRYPNATVDLAARMTQVQAQSRQDWAKVRAFFIAYQDRLMYGTDIAQNPGDNPAEVGRETEGMWRSDWRYLATGETQPIKDLHADIRGLALPRAVIDKIYYRNARRVYLSAGR